AAARGDVVDERWVQPDEFADWLQEETRPVRGTAHDADADAGTVLVWRENGKLAHAAVTIGDGWALVKPSQSWSSPRIVRPACELIMGWRYPGTRLERHRIERCITMGRSVRPACSRLESAPGFSPAASSRRGRRHGSARGPRGCPRRRPGPRSARGG